MKRADGVAVPGIASPLRLQGTPVEYVQAPPALGEHTNEVLGKLLGLSAEEIAGLRERGIV